MQSKEKKVNKRSIILLSVVTSSIICTLILGSVGYFVYNKYLKVNKLQDFITNYLKDYVNNGNLNNLIITKIEQYTGGNATIEEMYLDNNNGLFIENIKIEKDGFAVLIKNVNVQTTGEITLNEIVKTGKNDADKILINNIKVGFNKIILNEVTVNPTSQITIKNPRFESEKIVLNYTPLEILNKKFLVTGITVLSPEVSLVRRKNGIWLIMDTLKEVTDKFNLSEYTDLLANGVIFKDGTLHYIDKDFFPNGAIDVSGIDFVIKPFSGSLKNLALDGFVNDTFFGDYSVTGKVNLYEPALNIKLKAEDIVISENFVKNIPGIGENIWNEYKPIGSIGIDGIFHFYTENNKRILDRHIELDINDMETTYYRWPINISRVSGNIMIANNKININNVEGYAYQDGQQGTEVNCDAIFELGKPSMKIIVTANDIDITNDLIKKMPPVCQNLYRTLKPTGRADMNLIYTVSVNGKVNKDYKIELDCKDWELNHQNVPEPIKNINGQIVISNRAEKSVLGECTGNVQLKNIEGYFNDGKNITTISLNGELDMGSPKKFFRANIPSLNISNDLLNNLPAKYKNIKKEFTPNGEIDVDVIYDQRNAISKPDISVTVDCKDCELASSKFPVPLHNIIGIVKIKGNHISADNFLAKSYGGKVNGSAQMIINNSTYNYDGEFGFFDVDMENMFRDFFKINQKWPGLLSGNITFNQTANGNNKLKAKGNLTLKDGKISDVPIALSVINILNFALPTKVEFHSGYMNFLIEDDIIEIEEAKIYSDTVKLVARGKVNFDGTLDIMVIVEFTKNTLRDIPVLGPLFDFVVGGVRKRLTKVHLSGNISEPVGSMAMLSPIKKPIKSLFELFPENGNKTGTSTASPSE